jgi:hypothetical protein
MFAPVAERAMVPARVMSGVVKDVEAVIVPFTSKAVAGELVPTPIFPLERILILSTPLEPIITVSERLPVPAIFAPIIVLPDPDVIPNPANSPIAVFSLPPLMKPLFTSANAPTAVFLCPSTLADNAPLPTAVFHDLSLLTDNAVLPMAVLFDPVVLLFRALSPTATFVPIEPPPLPILTLLKNPSLLKVLTPLKVCAALVTTPARVAEATGSVALVPVEESMRTTVPVEEPILKFVGTFTCAPAAIPSSFVLSVEVRRPAILVVAAGITALSPVLEVTVP